ncbi:hypothetical protein Q4489_04305 [Thalassotalea sp. 1_MG-2023]|uniref:hypothetical protein n=1 Tax=Thalassotalea sp. 1_MG-2023 TaxID=3062680 RepID=UPI0026E38891|nr:hypothetical protein [Thalassotalea sp. 1_MG-2023]MDO6426219.1 hypothetical protein [Thalassotalea sp. 1_MG-2023]
MGFFTKILDFFTAPIADLTGSYRERKRIAAEMAAEVATAEVKLKLAKINAKASREENKENNDISYDMQVLINRSETFMDGFIILVVFSIWIAHFIPGLQPIMAEGWRAMGYKGAPWYFEFIVVGIAVSTLGLMRLFRIFWRVKDEAPKNKTTD